MNMSHYFLIIDVQIYHVCVGRQVLTQPQPKATMKRPNVSSQTIFRSWQVKTGSRSYKATCNETKVTAKVDVWV